MHYIGISSIEVFNFQSFGAWHELVIIPNFVRNTMVQSDLRLVALSLLMDERLSD